MSADPTGKAYGLGMTDETLALARENQKKAGVARPGFIGIEVEPARVYNVEDAREFLTAKGIDVDTIAPMVEWKFLNAVIRAGKP